MSDASISSNGKFIAFSSNADPSGTNADRNLEIFRYDVAHALTTQITNTTTGDSEKPSISDNGKLIAFISNSDPAGSNSDGNQEIFLYHVTAITFTQVTNTTGAVSSNNPVILPNGKQIFFDSNADLVGTNADGTDEVFRYTVAHATTVQLTNTTDGDSRSPSPSHSGAFVAFESDSGQISGANADGGKEIYRLKVSNGSVRRLTDYTFDSSRPALSGNGRYVAFSTDGDPTGGNADGSTEVFLVKVNKATLHLTQVTSGATGTSNNRAVLNNTGKRTFFQSNADLTGAGAESITSSSS